MQRMHLPADENLPEVVYDTSPQVVSNVEAQYKEHVDGRHLYPVQYDDSPKFSVVDVANEKSHTPLSAASPGAGLPWEPVSAVEETPAGWGADWGGAAERAGERLSNERSEHGSDKSDRERRICGFRRRTFFIVFALAFVTIVAAVGGGVGGGITAARLAQGPEPSGSSTPTPLPASSTPSSVTSDFSGSSGSSSVPNSSGSLNSSSSPSATGAPGDSGASKTSSVSKASKASSTPKPSKTSKPTKTSEPPTTSKSSKSTKTTKTTKTTSTDLTPADIACLPASCGEFGCCSGKCDYWCDACNIKYSC